MKWTNLNPAKKPSPRGRAERAYLGDNKVIVFSGFPGVGIWDMYCTDSWIYDLKLNSWDSLNITSPVGREQGMMCELDSHRVLLYGGWGGEILWIN